MGKLALKGPILASLTSENIPHTPHKALIVKDYYGDCMRDLTSRENDGSRYWARTSDLFDVTEALYQLS